MEKAIRRPKVYVINDSGHDYEGAREYGDLVILTKGRVAAYAANNHYRSFVSQMEDLQENDYVLVTSLASLNAIVGWIIGSRGLPLNLLLYRDGKYIVRRLVDNLNEIGEDDDD